MVSTNGVPTLILTCYLSSDAVTILRFLVSDRAKLVEYKVQTHTHTHTHTHTTILRLSELLSRTTWLIRYQKKHSPTHTYHSHQSSLICFLHLLRSMASSQFNLRALQFFPQSLTKFSLVYLLACHPPLHTPYISSLNHCSTMIMSSNPSIFPNPLLGTLYRSFTPHIHLTILISAQWSAISFSFLTGQASLPCNILLCTQLLYNLLLTINDISLLVSNGINSLNLFHPIRILVSTAASASPSTLSMSPK